MKRRPSRHVLLVAFGKCFPQFRVAQLGHDRADHPEGRPSMNAYTYVTLNPEGSGRRPKGHDRDETQRRREPRSCRSLRHPGSGRLADYVFLARTGRARTTKLLSRIVSMIFGAASSSGFAPRRPLTAVATRKLKCSTSELSDSTSVPSDRRIFDGWGRWPILPTCRTCRALDDVHQPARSNAEAAFRDAMKNGDAPELVASAVVKASTAVTRRRRYAACRTARHVSLLRRFVPESAFDRSLRKQMRLPA